MENKEWELAGLPMENHMLESAGPPTENKEQELAEPLTENQEQESSRLLTGSQEQDSTRFPTEEQELASLPTGNQDKVSTGQPMGKEDQVLARLTTSTVGVVATRMLASSRASTVSAGIISKVSSGQSSIFKKKGNSLVKGWQGSKAGTKTGEKVPKDSGISKNPEV